MKKRDVRLTTAAHREAFDMFYGAFRDAGHREGWRSGETLRHFLEAGHRAIRGKMLLGEAWETNEVEYMKIVKSCRSPQETMRDLAMMLAATTIALAADPVDFVGPVFNEIAADAGMGQFFTPHELSYLIAKMTIPPREEALADKLYVTCQEPACGVGGMILATNLAFRDAGYDVAKEVHWFAVDVDRRAINGAYLQAALTDCSGVFVHGNTLSLETWGTSLTPAAFLNPKTFDRAPRAKADVVVPKPGQLEMF